VVSYFIEYTEGNEKDMFYSQGKENDQISGCIGHLRGDFESGNQFYHTWFDHQSKINNPHFKNDFQKVMDFLRTNEILKNRDSMASYCHLNPNAKIADRTYGFRVESDNYKYFIRCFPDKGDYNFYVYCFQQPHLREQTEIMNTQPKER